MAWMSIAAPVAGAVIGGLLNNSGSSASTSQTRAPWAPALPWLTSNVNRGQDLQNFYQANPFSDMQKQVYGNQFALSNNYRAMLPQLMGGLNQMPFDRTQPLLSRPQMFNFTQPASNASATDIGYRMIGNPFAQMAPTTPSAPTPSSSPSISGVDMNTLQKMIKNQQLLDLWKDNGS